VTDDAGRLAGLARRCKTNDRRRDANHTDTEPSKVTQQRHWRLSEAGFAARVLVLVYLNCQPMRAGSRRGLREGLGNRLRNRAIIKA